MGESTEFDKIIAIKGKFRAPEEKYYGIFVLLINQSSEFIDTAAIVVSMYSEIYSINLKESWKVFETKINRMKYENQFAQAITMDLQQSFKNIAMDPDFFEDVNSCIKKGDLPSIQSIISSLFSAIIHDRTIRVEVDLQEVTPEDLQKNAEPVDEPAKAESAAPEGIFLEVSLVISPVGGKLVNQLTSGEKILVRIVPNTDRANYFIDLWKIRGESGGIKPIQAEVVKIDIKGDTTELLVKFEEDGVFAKIIEEEKVLVKMYVPAEFTKEKNKPSKKPSSTTSMDIKKMQGKDGSKVMLLIGGAIFFIILGFVAIMMFSAE